MREIIDHVGAEWVVYAVRTDPNEAVSRRYLPNDYQQGWLVFESGDRKLRLAPIPMGWHEQTEDELRALLGEARPTTPTLPNGYRAFGAPEPPAESGRDDTEHMDARAVAHRDLGRRT